MPTLPSAATANVAAGGGGEAAATGSTAAVPTDAQATLGASNLTSTAATTAGGATTATATAAAAPKKAVNTDPKQLEAAISKQFGGAAAPEHRVGLPTGQFAGQAPKGVMMVVHGGGWYDVGSARVTSMEADAARWQARGWMTVNVDYAAGGKSIADVTKFYDAIRQSQGAGVPVGALGSSAGGQLALMVAAKRPDVAFVVSKAGATDLANLKGTARQDQEGAKAVKAFGAKGLAANSPVAQAGSIKAELLLAGSTADPIVPTSQQDALKRARPANTTLLKLQPGTTAFTHANVSAASFAQYDAAEDRLASKYGI